MAYELHELQMDLCRELMGQIRHEPNGIGVPIQFHLHRNLRNLPLPGWRPERFHGKDGHPDVVLLIDIGNDLHHQEIFLWNPYDPTAFAGWRLSDQDYVPIEPDVFGRLWSQELRLWLGPWSGEFKGVTATWLRFYQGDGRPVPLEAEIVADTDRQARNQQAQTNQGGPLAAGSPIQWATS